MEIYLVRHAIAEDSLQGENFYDQDHARPLSEKGRRKMQKILKKLREGVEVCDLLVSSPYKRARQTAELIASVYGGIKINEAPELVPHCPPSAFLNWLKAYSLDDHFKIFIVGHEPHLSSLASYLLSGRDRSFIELKKGGILCLETASAGELSFGNATLKWSLPPKFMLS